MYISAVCVASVEGEKDFQYFQQEQPVPGGREGLSKSFVVKKNLLAYDI